MEWNDPETQLKANIWKHRGSLTITGPCGSQLAGKVMMNGFRVSEGPLSFT